MKSGCLRLQASPSRTLFECALQTRTHSHHTARLIAQVGRAENATVLSTFVQRPAIAEGLPWRGWYSFRHFLLSKHFQAGVQLAAGELVVSLFFWRSELRYSSQCLLSTLYLLCSLLIPPDNHIGSKWVTSVLLVGSAWLACLLAGTTASSDFLPCT